MINLHNKGLHKFTLIVNAVIAIIVVVPSRTELVQAPQAYGVPLKRTPQFQDFFASYAYLPIIQKPENNLPVINIPYSNVLDFNISAVTWLGYVRDNHNYADIRIGYTDTLLYIWVAVFDKYVWYDISANIDDLTNWDAVTLHIDTDGNDGTELRPTMVNFTRQIQWYDDGETRQIAYQGGENGWSVVPIPFTTDYKWYGNAPNDNIEDRGYYVKFYIPFASLGLSKPVDQTKWGFGVTVHDRDNATGSLSSKIYWPQDDYDTSRSENWGRLSYGLPNYVTPPITNPQVITLYDGANGVHVTDQEVGGGTMCGDPTKNDFFGLWGDYNWGSIRFTAIQNQFNTSDWPCFSKFYLTFPLSSLPSDKTLSSAILSMVHFGGSTPWPGDPGWPIWIHVMTADEDWDEYSITWNNAPAPMENVSQAWASNEGIYAGAMETVTWDVSHAASEAISKDLPLRLILYTSDAHPSNGKYFFTSEDYNPSLRPQLTVTVGDPVK